MQAEELGIVGSATRRWTVGVFVKKLRLTLDEHVPTAALEGEVSQPKRYPSYYGVTTYFTLKDDRGALGCVAWTGTPGADLLVDGRKVLVTGRIELVAKSGKLSFRVQMVEALGKGDLMARYLARKDRLEKEGLFCPERKRLPPRVPRHVAVVTSLQTAALRDVCATVRRRSPWVRLTVFGTPVQGDAAVPWIVAALDRASASGADAVLLVRGGGSIEDLWCFNDERVVRAVVACGIPVITGIGHETDTTLADFAADLRAATPTAAAELAAPSVQNLRHEIDILWGRAVSGARSAVAQARYALSERRRRIVSPGRQAAEKRLRAERLLSRAAEALNRAARDAESRLGWLQGRLSRAGSARSDRARAALLQLSARMRWAGGGKATAAARDLAWLRSRVPAVKGRALDRALARFSAVEARTGRAGRVVPAACRARLAGVAGRLAAIDPEAVLSRGYAIAWTDDRTVAVWPEDLPAGRQFRVQLAGGWIQAVSDGGLSGGKRCVGKT